MTSSRVAASDNDISESIVVVVEQLSLLRVGCHELGLEYADVHPVEQLSSTTRRLLVYRSKSRCLQLPQSYSTSCVVIADTSNNMANCSASRGQQLPPFSANDLLKHRRGPRAGLLHGPASATRVDGCPVFWMKERQRRAPPVKSIEGGQAVSRALSISRRCGAAS